MSGLVLSMYGGFDILGVYGIIVLLLTLLMNTLDISMIVDDFLAQQ